MEEFPELRSSRLILNQLTPNDAEVLYQLFSDPKVVEYYDLAAFTSTTQAAELIELFQSRFATGQGIRWAIRLATSGDFIGTCGFNTWNDKMQQATIGYDLLPEFWNKGYTSEAVEAILSAAFSGQLPCRTIFRIQADTVVGNTASEALLTKLGFSYEGTRRSAGFWKDSFHDLKCFSLLKSDRIRPDNRAKN